MLIQPGDGATEECISELTFDEWHNRELSRERVLQLEAHVAGCTRCSARCASLREQRRAYLAQPQTQAVLDHIVHARTKHASHSGRWTRLLSVAALAAVALVFLQPSEETRTKGGSHFGFFVKRGDATYRGGQGERLQPGDRVRFTVRPGPLAHVAILAIDQSGHVSTYYPTRGDEAVRVEPSRDELALDGATELDEVLGEETILGLLCDRPLALEPTRRALARSGKVASIPGCRVEAIRIHKERAAP